MCSIRSMSDAATLARMIDAATRVMVFTGAGISTESGIPDFRSPGGVLFEVATNEPGFDRDEDTAHLGEALKLPSQHEHLRPRLENGGLEPIHD